MKIDLHALDASALSTYTEHAKSLKDTAGFLLKIIPDTAIDAFAKGDILQVLVFAVLFGSALSILGDKAQCVAVFYVSCFLFVFVVLAVVMRLAGFSIFKLVRYLREELSIVLGTASSDAVLPQIMRKLEWMGVKDSTVGLVVPTGYSFNLDGFSIYLTLAVIFITQATNTPLSLHDLIVVVLVSLVTSKGAHGIPDSAIVILAATLSAIPAIPVLGLVLILPVDWFVDIARAVTNLIGNCVATVVVAVWENDIDLVRAKRVLDQDVEYRFVPAAPESTHGTHGHEGTHAV